MRSEYFKLLTEAMRKDKKIFFLMADTGYNLVEPLFEEFPDRTLNVGIAEQNLIGIAAGLANMGFKPICYAISQFLVQRAYEQIRNDLCHHDYPVVLVGTSAGLDNGALWATHYVVDDIGCLKPLPNIQIYSPSSIESIRHIFTESMKTKHPTYIRITKSMFSEDKKIENPNRIISENKNSKILVISHGRMIKRLVEISKTLSNFSIFAIDKIKPLDESIKNILQNYSKIVVVEDNFSSGLFNSLCQFVIEKKMDNNKMYSICVPEDYGKNTGDTSFLDNKFGLNSTQISTFLQNLEKSRY
jgi:transketolase|tara:strand:- start:8467 stop:9369 length:903 start_codon:yes stop_codon:yes gene_type:complete